MNNNNIRTIKPIPSLFLKFFIQIQNHVLIDEYFIFYFIYRKIMENLEIY